MIAGLYAAVTDRRGFPSFLTALIVSLWVLRVIFHESPPNGDMKDQLTLMTEWRLVYGAGANPPLFIWLARLADGVLGHPVAAVELVRFFMLWLFCLLTAHTVRAMTGDGRLAALAGLSAFAIYAVGWETLFRYTHTMMLIASIPMTLAALLRLDRDNGPASYVLVAVVSAFGFYGKHGYEVVWIGFLGAALMDERLRGRLLHRRIVPAAGLALLLLSPLIYWLAASVDMAGDLEKLRIVPLAYAPAIVPPLSVLADLAWALAGLLAPLVPVLLLMWPRAFGRANDAGDADRTRHRALLRRYLLIAAAFLVVDLLMFGIDPEPQRTLYVLLPVLPLIYLRLASAGFVTPRRAWFAAILAILAVSTVAGVAVRGLS